MSVPVFVALGFVRFVCESRPASRWYPTPLCFGDFPGKERQDLGGYTED